MIAQKAAIPAIYLFKERSQKALKDSGIYTEKGNHTGENNGNVY